MFTLSLTGMIIWTPKGSGEVVRDFPLINSTFVMLNGTITAFERNLLV